MFGPVPVALEAGSSAPRLSRVLLVAGLSGAGKTTFLDQVVSGHLPGEIAHALPRGCAAWEQALAMEFEQFLARRQSWESVDVALHYSTLRLLSVASGAFIDDPVLQIIAQARKVVVVTVVPSPERLFLQFGRRSFGGATPAETHGIVRRHRLRDMVGKVRAMPSMLATKIRLGGTSSNARTDPQTPLEVLGFYRRHRAVQSVAKRWDEFLHVLAARRCLEREIVLAPAGDLFAASDARWTMIKVAERRTVVAERTRFNRTLEFAVFGAARMRPPL